MNRPSLSFKPCLIAASLVAAFSGNALAVDYVWTGGSFVVGTTAPSPLVAPDTLSINTGTAKTFSGVSFTNQSTVTWKANDIGFADSVVTNAGLWDAKGNDALQYVSGSPSQFINSGTFRKSGGTGSTTIGSNIVFINSGILDAQTGTIDFAGGSAYFNAGTQFTGSGINRVSNHATFSGAFTSANLVLAGGNFYGNNSQPAVLSGTVDWSGGQFVDSWQVASGQTLAVKSGSAKSFSATNFVNNGTVTWGAANDIGFADSVVTNAGLWDAKGNDALQYVSGSPSQFINSGTFRKSGGTVTTIGSNVVFINSGTLDAQTGTIDFAGGSAYFNAGTQFIGVGINRVSNGATFSGAFTSANLVLAGGNFYGNNSQPAVLSGTADWTAGQFVGSWQVAGGQTLAIKSGTAKNFASTNFVNNGTVTWGAANDIGFADSVVTNAGLWDAKGNDALKYVSGSPSQFINSGTFRKSGGAASTTIGANVVFINSGTLDAQTGTIDFAGGSAYFNAGTQFTGSGINRVSNHATFSGAFSSANLVLAGGNFYGNNSQPAVLSGTADWTAGQFVGSWQVAGGQTLAIKSGSAKNFASTNFVNNGTVTWGAANDIGFADSVVTNAGLWDAKGNDALKYVSGSPSQFINSGTFRKSGGTGSTTIGSNIVFINSGILDAQTGTIDFAGGSAYFNAGTQFIGAGINRVSNGATFSGAFTSANLVLAGGNFYGNNSQPAVLSGTADWTGGQFVGSWQVAGGQTLAVKSGSAKSFSATNFVNNGTVTWGAANDIGFADSVVTNAGLWDAKGNDALKYVSGSPSQFINSGTFRKSGGSGTTTIGNNVVFTNSGVWM